MKTFLKRAGLLVMILALILYCQKQHGDASPLKDYHHHQLAPPPPWAQHGVLYELYFRAFTPEGTIRAAIPRLNELKDLGVDIIWLMPVYPIGEKGRKGSAGSPYAVKDFRQVNPEYGTAEDLSEFIRQAHSLGLKVILDIVPNHAALDNPLTQTHPDWFMRDEKGQFTREVADWSDVIDFNYDNPAMRQYMKETFLYWIREFDVDGFRCDVAGMVPLSFWKETIPALRNAKPELFLLAEWEDPELLLAGFNSDYDWTLYHLLKDIRKGKKRSGEAVALIAEKDSLYPRNALPMRFLENHDEQRSMAVFGPAAIEAYATFLFTSPGIPLIYAGQEIGETHRPSLFEKEPIRWENGDRRLREMYQGLIRLRKSHPVFTRGDFIPLQTAMMNGSVGAFLRTDTDEAVLVVNNLRPELAQDVMVFIPKKWQESFQWEDATALNGGSLSFKMEKVYFQNIPGFTTWVFHIPINQHKEDQ